MKHVVKLRNQLIKLDDLLADYEEAVQDAKHCILRNCSECEDAIVEAREKADKQMLKLIDKLGEVEW